MREIPVYKPSLFDLWNRFRFPVSELVGNVSNGGAVHRMLGNQPVDMEEAQNVLSALSEILRKDFTLETVYVPVIASGAPQYEEKKVALCTQQEVQEHLPGLNRATYRLCDTEEAKRARSLMIEDHVQWFASNGIDVAQGSNAQWKLSP